MTARAQLTADAILAVPADQPGQLFTGDLGVARQEYRKFLALWHPDRCVDARATEVVQWLKVLFAAAETRLAAGTWETPGLLEVSSRSGARFQIRYARKLELEIGLMLIGKSVLAFVVEKVNVDILDDAERILIGLGYANEAMRNEFSRYFPEIVSRIETESSVVLVLKKTPDLLLLRDVLEHFQGRMPPRHVAWIISRLLNIACYLERQGRVAHNGISLESVFISPPQHSVALLGGWWFATSLGDRMRAASHRMTLFAPPDVLQKKLGDSRTDMEMIKALGRELLGDVTGVRLARDPEVPSAMANWLQLSSAQDAVSAFKEWQDRVLGDAFGQRRFVKLALDHERLYAKQGG